jgi:hypothetical protein
MPQDKPTLDGDQATTFDKCDPDCESGPRPGGPPREAGGTTGAGNLSPAQASRTGGATGGVPTDPDDRARDRNVPPSA